MKVADIMQKNVESVSPQSTVKEVARLIFGRGVNGLPVCVNKQVVGFVTEKDILAKFFPTVKEYMEDPVNTADFEAMEKRSHEIFRLPFEEESEFYNWLAKDYDTLNDWPQRLKGEIPDIVKLFKKENVKNVVDVA